METEKPSRLYLVALLYLTFPLFLFFILLNNLSVIVGKFLFKIKVATFIIN